MLFNPTQRKGIPGDSFDPGYQAILTYAAGLGYTLPSAACQTLQNALYVLIKNNIGWGKFRHFACYAVDGGDVNFACINWANTAKNVTRVNNPTFTNKQGITTNGTTQYLDCNILMNEGSITDRTTGLRLYTSGGTTTFGMGFLKNAGFTDYYFQRETFYSGTSLQTRNHRSDSQTPNATNNYRAMTRTGTASYNSIVEATTTHSFASYTVQTSDKLKIGFNGVSSYTATKVTHSHEGKALTGGEISNLITYFNDYMAAI